MTDHAEPPFGGDGASFEANGEGGNHDGGDEGGASSGPGEEYFNGGRFDVYPDKEMVTVIPTKELDNLAARFKELTNFASVVLGKPVSELKRDDILQFIEEYS